jgi:hypothetical protein
MTAAERIELAAAELLEEQAAATAAFAAVVITARAALAALEFPLGSPSRGYGLANIDATLGHWLTPRWAEVLEAGAFEIATEAEASASRPTLHLVTRMLGRARS